MAIRIGANPIIWSNDDLRELGGETALETCLSQARTIGFEGMELGHKFPREPAALAHTLRKFDLACISGWYSARLLERDVRAELASLRPHLDLLKAVGSPVLVFAEVSGAVHGDLKRPLSQRPTIKKRCMAGIRPAYDRACGTDGRGGRASGLPSPHGNGRAE